MKEKQKDEGCGGFWLIKDHYYDKTYSVTSHYYIFTSAIEARMQPKRTKWGPFKFLFCQFFGCKVTQTNHKAMTMFNWMFLMFQNSLNQKNECTWIKRPPEPSNYCFINSQPYLDQFFTTFLKLGHFKMITYHCNWFQMKAFDVPR